MVGGGWLCRAMGKSGGKQCALPTNSEAVSELVDVFVQGLEMVRDVRINSFLGITPEADKPRQALYWRSRATTVSLSANLQGLQALFEASGLAKALTGDSAHIGQSVAAILTNSAAALDGMGTRPSPTTLLMPKAARSSTISARRLGALRTDRRAVDRRARPLCRLLVTGWRLMRAGLVDRRNFLRAAGAGFVAASSPSSFAATLRADAVFATAFQKRDGSYGAAILSEEGRLLHAIALPDRGHDITFDPVSKRSVVFARQPGTFAVVFDLTGKQAPHTIASVEGRHFYGHGVFSPDGSLLYATENVRHHRRHGWRLRCIRPISPMIGEFATHGVGPHELILLGDGRTIAVANGGIETLRISAAPS